jgi:hypothetical protein
VRSSSDYASQYAGRPGAAHGKIVLRLLFLGSSGEQSGGVASVLSIRSAPVSAASERSQAGASLSVVVMTAGPGPRVASTLELLRPIAQEIIVALDDRAVADVYDDVAAVADRVIAYPFLEPVDRPLPWLFRECRCDWMLTLDDDEIPGVELLDALPSLVRDERVVHYSLSRRWVYPDLTTYLDDTPWQPDYQLRLFRTDPRLIRFSDELHLPIIPRGPGRFVREPIWHLDPVLRSEEERRAKADRYEAMRPGLRAGGRALNYAFYVPEARPDAPVARIGEADRRLLASLVAATRRTDSPRTMLETVTRATIDAHWPTHRAEQSGTLALVGSPPELFGEERRAIDVLVENTSSTMWQWGRVTMPTVRCAAWWDDAEREEAVWTPLPAPVAPGEAIVVPVHVQAPAQPGTHRLTFDLVHEGVRWLGCDVACEVTVRPRRRVAFVGVDAAAIREELARDPEIEPVVVGEKLGYPEAVGPSSYLFADAPAGSLAFSAAYVARAARLLLATRSGLGLPRPGRSFLDALRTCERVIAAPTTATTRRDRWTHSLTIACARLLRIPVTPRR